jgi:hypothetical protein
MGARAACEERHITWIDLQVKYAAPPPKRTQGTSSILDVLADLYL